MENQMLSRRSEYCPEKGSIEKQPITTVLGKNHFEEWQTQSFICSLARLASLPERKVDRGIPGKYQGRREKG